MAEILGGIKEKMPSNPDTLVSFRDAEISQALDTYNGREQRHQRAKISLQRYQFLIEQTLLNLEISKSDLEVIWGEVNGCSTSHFEMLPILRQGIISALRDNGNTEVAARLASLSLLEWFAVVDLCDRVGAGNFTIENIGEEIERLRP